VKKQVLLVGAGAVGVYFAGRLARSSEFEVSVVARSEFEAAKENGYQIASIAGDFQWRPPVYRSAREYGKSADLIVVASKVLPEANAPLLAEGAVGANTTFLLIQNGLDIEQPFAAAFPESKIISAIAFIGVSRCGGGRVAHTLGGTLSIADFQPEKRSWGVTTAELKAAFDAHRVPCSVDPDCAAMRWRKQLWNVPYNPLSVLTGGMDTQEMSGDPQVSALAEEVMQEVLAVGRASGCDLDSSLVEYMVNYTRNAPAYKTSMLLDYENRRPMEVEAILGTVVKKARAANIPVPRVETFYALLSAKDRKNRQ